MPDKDEIKEDVTNFVEGVEGNVEGYLYGNNSTNAGSNFGEALGGLIHVDADAEGCVDEDVVTLYWDALLGMLGVIIFTILVAFLFGCCSKRCAGRWYTMMGLVHLIMGALLASVLMPTCDCAEDNDICSAHKYNPGPVWGAIVMVLGILFACKGCCMVRGANQEDAVENEGAKLLAQDDHGGFKDDQGGYKDDNELL